MSISVASDSAEALDATRALTATAAVVSDQTVEADAVGVDSEATGIHSETGVAVDVEGVDLEGVAEVDAGEEEGVTDSRHHLLKIWIKCWMIIRVGHRVEMGDTRMDKQNRWIL